MNLNHPRDPVRGLGAHQARLGLAMPERVDEELGRLVWGSFMGITGNPSIMGALADMDYIMVRLIGEN